MKNFIFARTHVTFVHESRQQRLMYSSLKHASTSWWLIRTEEYTSYLRELSAVSWQTHAAKYSFFGLYK